MSDIFHDESGTVLIINWSCLEVVKEVVDQQASLYENIHYVSNFIEWDEEVKDNTIQCNSFVD